MKKIDDMTITELKTFMSDKDINIINASDYERRELLIEVINKSKVKIIIDHVNKKNIISFPSKSWMKSNIDFDTITKIPSKHLNMEFYKLERDIKVGVKYEYFRYSIKDDVWCCGIYYDPNKIDAHMWFNKKNKLDVNETDEKKIKEFNKKVEQYDYLIKQLNVVRKVFLRISDDTIHIIKSPFEDLCESVNKINFVELFGKNEWIKVIILDLNMMGFYTYTSQPGQISNNVIVFKTKYDRKHNIDENIISNNNNFCRKQRAYVRGYMDADMATYIINKLEYNQFIYARSSNHNCVINDKIKLGSVIFKNDEPLIYEMSNEEDITKIVDACESYNLSTPLHRPLDGYNKIVEFDIIDRRWGENSYMWNTLYDIIKEYHK